MRRVVIAVVTIIVAGTVVGSASAGLARLYWLKTSASQIEGVRATVDNPAGSQRNITNPDAMVTAVEANNGNCDAGSETNCAGMQQGIVYNDGVPIDQPNGTCQNHQSTEMFYFVERDIHGTYTCYYEGAAATTEAHVQKVERDSSNKWWGYLDGVQQTYVTYDWTDCSSFACGIRALGEELNTKAGDWQAKFSGSGNTPWQFENSCCWNTINSYSQSYDHSLWTLNVNNFPNGLWTFIYHH